MERPAQTSARESLPPAVDDSFLPFALPDIDDSEISAVAEVLRSGWITTGPKVAQFEEEFSRLVGAGRAVAVSSCTAAMHLSLEGMGIGPGDEVITTAYTFVSTASVIEHLGARPVLVDVERETLNLDPNMVEAAITPRTRAVVPVHFAGHPADLAGIYDLASNHHLAIVEDCAHALPARYQGRLIGSDLDRTRYPGIPNHSSCFSFYATKTLTTGEGGMLCTDSDELASRARRMLLHGMSRDAWKRYASTGSWYYEVVASGFKYNMMDICAALGLVQLTKTERMWRRRKQIADAYSAAFGEAPELQPAAERPGVEHAWHIYPLRLRLDRLRIDRAAFIEELKARGVGTSVHFIPLHLHPHYRDTYGYAPSEFPVALGEYMREVSLPVYSRLTDRQVTRVIDAVLATVAASRKQPDRK